MYGFMHNPQEFQLHLPPSASRPDDDPIIMHAGVVVVIGPNGSGKTHLGAWLRDDSRNRPTRHIAAQKMLIIHSTATMESVPSAREQVKAFFDPNKPAPALGAHPNQGVVNDFHILHHALFVDQHDTAMDFYFSAEDPTAGAERPLLKGQVLQDIWRSMLPHRELVIDYKNQVLRTRISGPDTHEYEAGTMSDGERIVFYYIASCLFAPENAVIIVDEPESHLHKALQPVLWDRLQATRSDCQFVYLTHDLDFALSRAGAPIVCLTKFQVSSQGQHEWDWYLVPESGEVPEAVFLEIAGSRKSVLFVEGKQEDSLDYLLYRHLYPDYHVVPVESYDTVIKATASFAASPMQRLHRVQCRGIIDRDYRTEEHILHLPPHIYVLDVATAENLLLHEDVLEVLAADRLMQAHEISQLVSNIKDDIFAWVEQNKDQISTEIVTYELRRIAERFSVEGTGIDAVEAARDTLISHLDVAARYTRARNQIDAILHNTFANQEESKAAAWR
jgi:hypothetical protein